jgi:hypothetical protein
MSDDEIMRMWAEAMSVNALIDGGVLALARAIEAATRRDAFEWALRAFDHHETRMNYRYSLVEAIKEARRDVLGQTEDKGK